MAIRRKRLCPRCDERHYGGECKAYRVCPHCGKHFHPRHWTTKYCSISCSKFRELPTKDCAHCGETFRKNAEYSYAVWDAQRFCSNRCKGAGRKRSVSGCARCGAEFNPDHLSQTFCSQACYWLSMRSDRFPVAGPRYDQNFTKAQKRMILERDGAACRRCGTTGNLEFDHVIPVHVGGTNNIENSQILCRTCHRQKTDEELRRAATRQRVNQDTACPNTHLASS